jgi:hypothetical protein
MGESTCEPGRHSLSVADRTARDWEGGGG